MFRFLRIVLLMGLAAALSHEVAASELCARMNRELAYLSETYDAPAKVRKYARAIAEQKLSIRELRHHMRETGCSGGSLFIVGGENADACSELEEKMARMEANLSILNDKRLSLLTGQEDDDRRRRLVAAIEGNRCNEQPVLVSAEPVEPQGIEEAAQDMPGGFETIRVPQSDEGYGAGQFIDLGGSSTTGSYRTMCVRTCDGAYFPISSMASSTSFQRDAQVCSMMCPGMETELFYHSIRQESDSMRSAVTGRPYNELENAYSFRTRSKPRDGSCGCNFSLYYKEMMRREAFISDPVKHEPKQSAIVWIKPEFRGKLDSEPSNPRSVKEAALRDYRPDRNIRQIGPKFLPDDEGVTFGKPNPVARN